MHFFALRFSNARSRRWDLSADRTLDPFFTTALQTPAWWAKRRAPPSRRNQESAATLAQANAADHAPIFAGFETTRWMGWRIPGCCRQCNRSSRGLRCSRPTPSGSVATGHPAFPDLLGSEAKACDQIPLGQLHLALEGPFAPLKLVAVNPELSLLLSAHQGHGLQCPQRTQEAF